MAANHKRSAVEGLGDRIPEPIKIGLLVAWLVAILALQSDRVNGDVWPPVLWAFIGLGAGLYLILLLARAVATLGRSTRAPRELDLSGQEWLGFFALTGGLLIMGPWWAFDGRPSTNPLIGGIGSLVGRGITILFVRHMLKPVQRGGGPAW